MAAAEATEAQDNPALEWPARVGLVGYGVIYLLVGWLAGQLAFGDSAGQASGSGALQQLAQQPLGAVTLVVVACGLAALAVWEACRAFAGYRDQEGLRRWTARAGSAGRTIVFATLATMAAGTGLGISSCGSSQTLTARLMALPLGPAIVVAVGVGVAAVGVASAVKGIGDRWRRDVERDGRTGTVGGVVAALARTGYVTRAVAFLTVGGFVCWAGLTQDAKKSGGLDQAIVRLRDEAYGPWLILVVAVGLGCFGAYHVFRAWYLRGT